MMAPQRPAAREVIPRFLTTKYAPYAEHIIIAPKAKLVNLKILYISA